MMYNYILFKLLSKKKQIALFHGQVSSFFKIFEIRKTAREQDSGRVTLAALR